MVYAPEQVLNRRRVLIFFFPAGVLAGGEAGLVIAVRHAGAGPRARPLSVMMVVELRSMLQIVRERRRRQHSRAIRSHVISGWRARGPIVASIYVPRLAE